MITGQFLAVDGGLMTGFGEDLRPHGPQADGRREGRTRGETLKSRSLR